MAELDDARYISLTTYKRNGDGVATPVWIARSHETYVFTTGDQAWKTRRLRNNPAVTVQVSDLRGRVAADAAVYTGTGVVKTDHASVADVERAIAEKYGWQFTATRLLDWIKTTFRIDTQQEVVAVELTFHAAE